MHNSVARLLIYTTVVFSACAVPLHGGVHADGHKRCSALVKACLAGVKEITQSCEQAVKPEEKKTSFTAPSRTLVGKQSFDPDAAFAASRFTNVDVTAAWLLHKSSIELLI